MARILAALANTDGGYLVLGANIIGDSKPKFLGITLGFQTFSPITSKKKKLFNYYPLVRRSLTVTLITQENSFLSSR